jgi:hypothetical protein
MVPKPTAYPRIRLSPLIRQMVFPSSHLRLVLLFSLSPCHSCLDRMSKSKMWFRRTAEVDPVYPSIFAAWMAVAQRFAGVWMLQKVMPTIDFAEYFRTVGGLVSFSNQTLAVRLRLPRVRTGKLTAGLLLCMWRPIPGN